MYNPHMAGNRPALQEVGLETGIDIGGKSTIGIVGSVILALIGLVGGWFKYRAAGKSDIMKRIEETQEALRVALENGMITDARRLNRRLDRLWRLYRKNAPVARSGSSEDDLNTPMKVSRCLLLVAAWMFLLMALTGCGSVFGKDEPEYVLIGERINIVEPGQDIKVPELMPPAKKWYLVDNVGLEAWLGLGDPRYGR